MRGTATACPVRACSTTTATRIWPSAPRTTSSTAAGPAGWTSSMAGTSVSATGDVTIDGAAADDLFGYDVAGIRDVEGTSLDDVLIGAPGSNVDGAGAGRVYLLEGGRTSATTLPGFDHGAGPQRPGQRRVGLLCLRRGRSGRRRRLGLRRQRYRGQRPGRSGRGRLPHHRQAGTIVRNELSEWEAGIGTDGTIRLDFALAEGAAGVDRLVLVRERLDDRGLVFQREELWSGPALAGVDGDVTLLRTALGLAFLDRRDPGSAASLRYELTVEETSGVVLRFGELEGAGAGCGGAAAGPGVGPGQPEPLQSQHADPFPGAGRRRGHLPGDGRARGVASPICTAARPRRVAGSELGLPHHRRRSGPLRACISWI